MKKIEIELNDFCPIDCPYLDIAEHQIWKEGEQEPLPRSYGLEYSCKNMTLCQCVVEKNRRPEEVTVEVSSYVSIDSYNCLNQAYKKYLCPSCNFCLMSEIFDRNLIKFIDVYSSFSYDGKKRRPKFCPRCGKELIYPSDCKLEE